MSLSAKALAKIREAGVQVDSVALANEGGGLWHRESTPPSAINAPVPPSTITWRKYLNRDEEGFFLFGEDAEGNPVEASLGSNEAEANHKYEEFLRTGEVDAPVRPRRSEESAFAAHDMSNVNNDERNAAITKIARKFLNVKTLATRNSDSADFHTVSVWGLKSALEAAFTAGLESYFNPSSEASASVQTDPIDDVVAFAAVSADKRVQQSLVTASACAGTSVADMAFRFAAIETLAAYNATPDHATKVAVNSATIAAVATALSGNEGARPKYTSQQIVEALKAGGLCLNRGIDVPRVTTEAKAVAGGFQYGGEFDLAVSPKVASTGGGQSTMDRGEYEDLIKSKINAVLLALCRDLGIPEGSAVAGATRTRNGSQSLVMVRFTIIVPAA